jgi:hypothetical protein
MFLQVGVCDLKNVLTRWMRLHTIFNVLYLWLDSTPEVCKHTWSRRYSWPINQSGAPCMEVSREIPSSSMLRQRNVSLNLRYSLCSIITPQTCLWYPGTFRLEPRFTLTPKNRSVLTQVKAAGRCSAATDCPRRKSTRSTLSPRRSPEWIERRSLAEPSFPESCRRQHIFPPSSATGGPIICRLTPRRLLLCLRTSRPNTSAILCVDKGFPYMTSANLSLPI